MCRPFRASEVDLHVRCAPLLVQVLNECFNGAAASAGAHVHASSTRTCMSMYACAHETCPLRLFAPRCAAPQLASRRAQPRSARSQYCLRLPLPAHHPCSSCCCGCSVTSFAVVPPPLAQSGGLPELAVAVVVAEAVTSLRGQRERQRRRQRRSLTQSSRSRTWTRRPTTCAVSLTVPRRLHCAKQGCAFACGFVHGERACVHAKLCALRAATGLCGGIVDVCQQRRAVARAGGYACSCLWCGSGACAHAGCASTVGSGSGAARGAPCRLCAGGTPSSG